MADDCVELIRDRYRLAVKAHSDLSVDLDKYTAHLQHISNRYLGSSVSEDSQVAFLKSLHTNDLLLALACAMGIEAGWKRFHSIYRKYLCDLSHHLLSGSRDLEELGETIWVDLFLPDKTRQSRIASYDGRSSLSTWLRVVVSNRVINERQRRSAAAGNIDVMPEPADPRALYDVEDLLRRGRYNKLILSAFRRVLSSLTDHEAVIVLMRYDQGLQLGEIARLFSVHQSTITRQLERVVERLRRDVVVVLSSQYGLNGAQVEECLSVASETFAKSVSILTFLRERVPQGTALSTQVY